MSQKMNKTVETGNATDGCAVFVLSRDEIRSRGVYSLALKPDFARAHKGDDGFWVFSSEDRRVVCIEKGGFL
jgi:hypothetical protein